MPRTRQEPPHDPSWYAGFPNVELPVGAQVFRAHDRGQSAYRLSSHGRFGITGSMGTCYVGDSWAVALRERIGACVGILSQALAERFVVSELEALRSWKCADTSHVDAAKFGVTRALQSSDPVNVADPSRIHDEYLVEPQFARCFLDAGLEGIRYGATFSPDYGPNAWALFHDRDAAPPMVAVRTITAEQAALLAGLKLESRSRRLADFSVVESAN